MANMTAIQFRDYVVNDFRRQDKDTSIYEATRDTIMDVRLRTLSDEMKEEAYTDEINQLGEFKLGLPIDFGHLIGDITVYDKTTNQTYGTITKVSKETYDELYPDRHLDVSHVIKGIPCRFTIFAGQIYLGPVPDKTSYTYQINYTTESEPEIDGATQEITFSDRHRYMLKAGVLRLLYLGLGFDQEGAKWDTIYERELGKFIENDEFNIFSSEPIKYSGV